MSREPIPTSCFSLVVVRRDDRFLIIQEKEFGQTWFLPAGRVDPGESFVETALRETREEAGIAVILDGILRIEHTPIASGQARLRVIFLAHPADDSPLKSVPDDESLGAAWVTLAELEQYPLRSPRLAAIFKAAAVGSPFPLAVLSDEDAPYEV